MRVGSEEWTPTKHAGRPLTPRRRARRPQHHCPTATKALQAVLQLAKIRRPAGAEAAEQSVWIPVTTTWQPRQVLGERFERKGQFDLPLPREAHTGHTCSLSGRRGRPRGPASPPGARPHGRPARLQPSSPRLERAPSTCAGAAQLMALRAHHGGLQASVDPARGWLGARCGRPTDHERPFAPGAGIQPTLTGAQRAATARRGGRPRDSRYPPTSVYKIDVVLARVLARGANDSRPTSKVRLPQRRRWRCGSSLLSARSNQVRPVARTASRAQGRGLQAYVLFELASRRARSRPVLDETKVIPLG